MNPKTIYKSFRNLSALLFAVVFLLASAHSVSAATGYFKISDYAPGGEAAMTSPSPNSHWRGYVFTVENETVITGLIGGGSTSGFRVAIYAIDETEFTNTGNVKPTSVLRWAASSGNTKNQLLSFDSGGDLTLSPGTKYLLAQGRQTGSGFHYIASALNVPDIISLSPIIADWKPNPISPATGKTYWWNNSAGNDQSFILNKNHDQIQGDTMPGIGMQYYYADMSVPTVVTSAPEFTGSQVSMKGELSNHGGGDTTTSIVYGTNSNLSSGTLFGSAGIVEAEGGLPAVFGYNNSSLAAGTWYYRARAENLAGSNLGSILSFNVYDLSYGVGSGGTITGGSQNQKAYSYDADGAGGDDPVYTTGAAVTATPNEGYVFVGWTDDYTEATRADTGLNGSVEVNALFELDTSTFFAGGDGESEETAYLINSCEQLQNVMFYDGDAYIFLDKYFKLQSDIDCSMTNPDDDNFDPEGPWSSEVGFEPIGIQGAAFQGSFNGNNKVISNLYMNNEDPYIGLFGDVGGSGEIYDLGVVDADITGAESTGIIAGRNQGSILRSYTTGQVYAEAWATGGFAGENTGTISQSYANVSVESTDDTTGGFVGYNEGVIQDAYATGNVIGDDWVGGFVGYNYGQIYYSYSTGDVHSTEDGGGVAVGGFVGDNGYDTIYSSFSVGSVSVTGEPRTEVGGFLGVDYLSHYNTGWWTGAWDGPAIGLLGGVGTPVLEIDWNQDNKDDFKNSSFGLYSVTSDDMEGEYDAEPFGIWNFSSIWTTNGNTTYPVFQWQDVEDIEEEEDPEPEPTPPTTSTRRSSGGGTRSQNTVNNASLLPSSSLPTTVEGLQALISQLQAQLQALLPGQSVLSNNGLETRDLTMGMSGDDVRALQSLLIAQGYPIPAGATGFFATQTRDALAAYQAKNNIVPSVGYFGTKTRTQMKSAGLSGLWW